VSCAVNHSDRTVDRYLRGSSNFLLKFYVKIRSAGMAFNCVYISHFYEHLCLKCTKLWAFKYRISVCRRH